MLALPICDQRELMSCRYALGVVCVMLEGEATSMPLRHLRCLSCSVG